MHTYHLFDAHHTLSRTRFLSSTISCASLVWIMDGAMVPGGADCLVPVSEVQSGIKPVLDQDMALQDASATENERIGMAAISLSQLLDSDGPFMNETHKQAFKLIRSTDTKRFHMLCARIAADIVTNPEIQTDALATHYVVPWDSALETFFKDAIDEPAANESGFTAN